MTPRNFYVLTKLASWWERAVQWNRYGMCKALTWRLLSLASNDDQQLPSDSYFVV